MSTPLPHGGTSALQPVRGFPAACRVSWYWTRAFTARAGQVVPVGTDRASSPRRHAFWRLLAVLARPGYWLSHMLLIGVWGPSVVELGRAGARVSNPKRTGRRSRPAPLVLLPTALLLLAVFAAAFWAGWLAVCAVVGLLAAAAVVMLRSAHSTKELNRQRSALAQATGRPVTIGETFGAWPTGARGGTALLLAILAELHTDGVGLIVHAVDQDVADWYGRHGGQVRDADFPLIVSW